MSRYDWSELKELKRKRSAQFRAIAHTLPLTAPRQPLEGLVQKSAMEWIRHMVTAEPYWFQKIEIVPGFYSPGWSDPRIEKLPYYGLPADLTGKRVLDIG